MTLFSLLPTETLLTIFPFVHPGTLIAFSSVNKRIYQLSRPFLDEHHSMHARYTRYHFARDELPDLAAAIINNPRIGYYIHFLSVCRLDQPWPKQSRSLNDASSARDVSGNVLEADHEHRTFLIETFHRALTKLGYGLFAGFVNPELTVDHWKQEISRDNREAMVAITIPYLSNLKSFACQGQTSSLSLLLYAFEYVVESRVRSSLINPDYNLPSMVSTGPFDSLKYIRLARWQATASASTAQLLKLFALPSLEKLIAGLIRPVFYAKGIGETNDERSDVGQDIVRVEEAGKPKLPLKTLILFDSCIWQCDLTTILDRTQGDKLETFSYGNIPYNWPGFSAAKLVVSLLNNAKRSLLTVELHVQNPHPSKEPYRGPGEVSSDDDVLNNRGWAVGTNGFHEFQVLNSLVVSADIILGGYGRWYKTPRGDFQLLANKPGSGEWELVDLLPKSLDSLIIRANGAQWPLMVERFENLLRDDHEGMDNLAHMALSYVEDQDIPSVGELVELGRRRGFAVDVFMGLSLRKGGDIMGPVESKLSF